MKIAVFHNLPSGGGKRALYNNVNYLVKDHEVDVFVPSTANEDYLPLKGIVDNLTVFPVKNTSIGFLISFLKPYFLYRVSLIDLERTQKFMADVVNTGDYDVVYCEQDRYTMAPFFLKYIQKPNVYYCNQSINFRNEVSKMLNEKAGLKNKDIIGNIHSKLYGSQMINTDKKYSNYSRYVVTNSYFSRELILRSYGINSFVSYLGVNTNLFKRYDSSKENFVLSVGQCLPEKGFDFIIKALSKIDDSSRPEFIIVSDHGNDLWRNYLINLASKLKVKLRILSMIDDEELILLYNKARLLVYAPYLEPFGLVPLEAMSCGTPIVAVKEGGVRESVIHNQTGILTERDEDYFANAIVKLLEDEDKRNEMSKNAYVNVNKFWTLEHAGERFLGHLERAIDKHVENVQN
jgi:glycosyltransferase involved in cell wall biosynthesis